MQNLVIHHRMYAGGIAKVAQVLRQNATQQREPQIGAHGLRAGDPVIARRALHRLMALVDNHGNGVVVVGCDRRTRRVVAVVGPVRAGGQTYGIDAQEIKCCLDIGGVAFGGVCDLLRSGIAILQQNKCAQRRTKRIGRG